jgi:hypothetical protein
MGSGVSRAIAAEVATVSAEFEQLEKANGLASDKYAGMAEYASGLSVFLQVRQ